MNNSNKHVSELAGLKDVYLEVFLLEASVPPSMSMAPMYQPFRNKSGVWYIIVK